MGAVVEGAEAGAQLPGAVLELGQAVVELGGAGLQLARTCLLYNLRAHET